MNDIANKGESEFKNSDHAEFVIKIEPKEDGPLFCETHFYIACAKESQCMLIILKFSCFRIAKSDKEFIIPFFYQ